MSCLAGFKLTKQQEKSLKQVRKDNRVQTATTAKWIVIFADGKAANYLTEYCHDRESAFIASVERFGERVKDVI